MEDLELSLHFFVLTASCRRCALVVEALSPLLHGAYFMGLGGSEQILEFPFIFILGDRDR